MLLLGKIHCPIVLKTKNFDEQLFETRVPIEVTISRVPDFIWSKIFKSKVLFNGKFTLDNRERTTIEFPVPILIHAEVKYEIRLDLQQSVYG